MHTKTHAHKIIISNDTLDKHLILRMIRHDKNHTLTT